MLVLRFDPVLVEAVVTAEIERRAKRGDTRLAKDYHRLGDPLYETVAPDQLDAAFEQIHSRFFADLGFTRLMAATFAEFPELQQRAPALLVLAARVKSEEGAVIGRDGQSVCLRILPQRFADREHLTAFTRHELLHAADMLDEAFGYRVEQDESIGATNLLADRYRALWCAQIDARLTRRGLAPLVDHIAHRRDFDVRFAQAPSAVRAEAFERLWKADRLTHAEITATARHPDLLGDHPRAQHIAGAACPLCRFPTHRWADDIAPFVVALIRHDFPAWQAEDGACERCVEVYTLRTRMGVMA